jgi:hypothetical protein
VRSSIILWREALSPLTVCPKALAKIVEGDPVNETRLENNNKRAELMARIDLKLLPFDPKRRK